MRMLSDVDSLAGGGAVDQGSLAAAPTTGMGLAVIVAALLCVLVAGFSFHSLLRCALRYCGRGGRRGIALLPAGLKESALRRMPVAVYEFEAPGSTECAICLDEFADGDAVRLLPRCRHGFHVRCIDTWLGVNSSYPICRDSLHNEDDEGVATGGRGRHIAPRRRAHGWLLSSLLAM